MCRNVPHVKLFHLRETSHVDAGNHRIRESISSGGNGASNTPRRRAADWYARWSSTISYIWIQFFREFTLVYALRLSHRHLSLDTCYHQWHEDRTYAEMEPHGRYVNVFMVCSKNRY